MSAGCQCYTIDIAAPVALALQVDITAGGLIDHIHGETYADTPADDYLRVMRAVLLVGPMIEGLQNRGELISDALRHLPDTAEFAVERSILTPLAVLQSAITPTFTGKAA